jgi:hypothetical protein
LRINPLPVQAEGFYFDLNFTGDDSVIL